MKKLLQILPVLLALCLWVSCKDTKAKSQRIMPVEILADGDLVFRRGTGLLSHIVTSASKDGVYSHIGILKKIGDEWFVIHAVPDEPDFEGDSDRVKIDSLSRFFMSDRAVRGMIARITEDTLAASKAACTAWEMARRGILFDHDYNLADTSRMYCSELVEFAYRKAGICLSEGRRTQIHVPAMGGTYLMPDDIAHNRKLKIIYSFPSN